MLPLFWRNRLFNKSLGTVLSGLCLLSVAQAQTSPLQAPASTNYPGILQTFERLIQVDNEKFQNRTNFLIRNGRVLNDSSSVTNIDLEPDFINSIILNSNAGYIKLASQEKCRFYDTILTDLLKTAEGKVKNVFVTFVDNNGKRQSSLMNRKDFLTKVVDRECPQTRKLIDQYQIKNLSETLSTIRFEVPTAKAQCSNILLEWLGNPHTPYLCQIHEYMEEVRLGRGNQAELTQKRGVARILEQKLNGMQKDYLKNLCTHLDDEDLFCEEFLSVSFWNKVASGYESNVYIEDICRAMTKTDNLSPQQIQQCLGRVKKEHDLCLYPAGRGQSLTPQMDCESLSMALNHSSLRANYQDCPGNSDQHAVTNITRILLNISQGQIQPYGGTCASISLGEAYAFNAQYDNDESWKLEACYDDKVNDREVCQKTYFGEYGQQDRSYTQVVASILKAARGADQTLTCKMVDSQDYNSLLLQFKSGCFIIYERTKCFMSECKHKIIFNDRPIDFIRIKNRLTVDYFPATVREERFSQHYLLTRDHGQKGKPLNSLSNIQNFYKKSKKGIIHGVGCGEDILPTFFKRRGINQCSPLPFIIDGYQKIDDTTVFTLRTAVDSLQAPRLVSFTNVYSAVRTYQRYHPLKLWTLYGLD